MTDRNDVCLWIAIKQHDSRAMLDLDRLHINGSKHVAKRDAHQLQMTVVNASSSLNVVQHHQRRAVQLGRSHIQRLDVKSLNVLGSRKAVNFELQSRTLFFFFLIDKNHFPFFFGDDISFSSTLGVFAILRDKVFSV